MHRLLRRAGLQVAPVSAAVVHDALEADAGGEDGQAAVLEVGPVLLGVGVVAGGAVGPADGEEEARRGVGTLGQRVAPVSLPVSVLGYQEYGVSEVPLPAVKAVPE